MFKINRQKYLDILKAQGLNKALTTLHLDMEALEQDTFEGPEGYQRGKWDSLPDVRDFSRELWDVMLSDPATYKP